MDVRELIIRIFCGPANEEIPENPNEREFDETFTDEIYDVYQEWGLGNRPAITPLEAAVKLLVDCGFFDDSRLGYHFSNADFEISSCSHTVAVAQWGPFYERQQIFKADTQTGSCDSNATLPTLAKLIDLANGQAFVHATPKSLRQTPAAYIVLKQLDTILTQQKGPGDQSLETEEYELERQGTTVTLRHPPKSNNLVLTGDIEQMLVDISYLSSIDARNIDNAHQLITGYDYGEQAALQEAELIIGSEKDIISKMLPAPLSNDDLNFSWAIPQGDIDALVDDITAQAVIKAASMLIDSIEAKTYNGPTYRVVSEFSTTEIQDLQGQTRLKHNYFESLLTFCGITIDTATEILRFVRDNEEQLRQQWRDITEQSTSGQKVAPIIPDRCELDTTAPPKASSLIGEDLAQQVLAATKHLVPAAQHPLMFVYKQHNKYTVKGTVEGPVEIIGPNQQPLLLGNHVSGQIINHGLNHELANQILDDAQRDAIFSWLMDNDFYEGWPPITLFATAVSMYVQNCSKDGDTVLSRKQFERISEQLHPHVQLVGPVELFGPNFVEGLTVKQLWNHWGSAVMPQPNFEQVDWNFEDPYSTTARTEPSTFSQNSPQKTGVPCL